MEGYGLKIKEYRKMRKISQEKLGHKVGVSKSFISKVESETTTPSLEMLNKIAEALEVDIVDLFPNKKEPPEELRKAGVEWMILGKELEEKGITKEQVELWAEIATKHTKSD